MEIWLWMIGMVLLLSAMLFRLLRVHRIFKAYGKMSHYWKDKYLVLWILIILSGAILILITWTCVDSIRLVSSIDYQPNTPVPYFEKHSICSSDTFGIFLAVALSYNGILMVFVVFLAVQTRKIRLSNFKNTKQINVFAATLGVTLTILVPLWLVIDVSKEDNVNGHLIVCSVFLCPAIYCHVFLFLPQVFVTVKNIMAERKVVGRVQLLKRSRQSQFHIP